MHLAHEDTQFGAEKDGALEPKRCHFQVTDCRSSKGLLSFTSKVNYWVPNE